MASLFLFSEGNVQTKWTQFHGSIIKVKEIFVKLQICIAIETYKYKILSNPFRRESKSKTRKPYVALRRAAVGVITIMNIY